MHESPLQQSSLAHLSWSSRTHARVASQSVDSSATLINSLVDEGVTVGPNVLLSHCKLQSDVCDAFAQHELILRMCAAVDDRSQRAAVWRARCMQVITLMRKC